MLAPWCIAAGITLHVFLEHDDPPGADRIALDALWHGHRHSADAPDHEHGVCPAARAKPDRDASFFEVLQRGGMSSAGAAALKVSKRALAESAFPSGADSPPGISPLRI